MLLIGNENKLINTPPDSDEVEVSIFGSGYGESILLHVGGNNWFIVDSCIDPITKESVILNYLKKIKVDPVKDVKQIIATHWHDDHVRGLGEIVRKCELAEFVYSIALKANEFIPLVQLYDSDSMITSSGIDEFSSIIKTLLERGNKPKPACADRCLWQGTINTPDLIYQCVLFSLSPSDYSIYLSQQGLARLLPQKNTSKKRIISLSPNHAAVVLLFQIKDSFILLGSDLEETGNAETGWTVIVNSKTRPQGRASIFKIPHHGSDTAHHQKVWTELLYDNPIAVLTPFNRGYSKLPKEKDVDRICNLTKEAYSTANLKQRKFLKRSRTVEKTIRETVRNIRFVDNSIGHVRLRSKLFLQPVSWKIELLGDALPLKKLYDFKQVI